MEKSTLIGIFLGLFAVVVGMILKGANPIMLFEVPAAWIIIFVGTAASIFMGFPLAEIKKIPKLFKILFKKKQLMPKKDIISLFMDWASITRREGLLALESKVEEVDEPFLKNGMRMIIDGNDQEFVRDVLLEEIAAMEGRHRAGALIFSQAGMYAPTLGVLGAVVGLIAALGNLSEMDKLAHSIAAAFVATLLGIFSGYVLWHPFSNKLKRISSAEVEIKMMMVEGLLSIQSGVSTIAINQKLSVFLTPTERYEESDKEETGDEEKAQSA